MRFQLGVAKAITAVGGLLLLLAAGGAGAQQPSQDQISAIRQSCRSDFMANCSGVQPGGKDALECLKQNIAKLSGSCKTAVSAIMPPPAVAEPKPSAPPAAPAAVAPPPAPAAAPVTASPPSTAPNPAPAPAPKSSKPAAAPVKAAAPAAAAKPTPEQTNAVRSACRSDFMAHCSGITPGGAEALQCLQSNSAQLSAPCQSAVAAIGGSTGAAIPPAPATAAAVAAPGFPPLGPVRPMLPQRAVLIRAICHADLQAFCAGVPPIGPAGLSCLAENGPHLSPECYKALAPVTR
ncbi:MAG TPA: cysteine rich repeat-containing protein [Xanthobacteraceae bacterium]